MSFLARGYKALKGEKGKEQTVDETISKLCERLKSSTLLEDKRAASLSLKSLSKQYPANVRQTGFHIFLAVLQRDKEDLDSVKATLETLVNICQVPQDGREEDKMAAILAMDGLLSDLASMECLLDLMKQMDFYVRYLSMQLLLLLGAQRAKQLQDAIIINPQGISTLVAFLEENREVLRNDTVLLLIHLSHENLEIQKLIAFESVFEKTLIVLDKEGNIDGGLISHDCLRLIRALLHANSSNQDYFRETGCLEKLSKMFIKSRTTIGATSAEKALNLVEILLIFRTFVVRNHMKSYVNQGYFRNISLLSAVIELSVSDNLPSSVLAQSLYTVGDMIRGNVDNQRVLQQHQCNPRKENVNSDAVAPPMSSLSFLCQTAINSSFSLEVRTAVCYAMQSYLFKNEEGKKSIIDSMVTMTSNSLGQILFGAMHDWEIAKADPYLCWIPCTILSHTLKKNDSGKEMLNNFNTELREDSPPLMFMTLNIHNLIFASQEPATDRRICLGLYMLLAFWLHQHPPSVLLFLQDSTSLQFLIEQVSPSSKVDLLNQGLAAFLLVLCMEFNTNTGSFPVKTLMEIITTRIGMDHFLSKLNHVRMTDQMKSANPYFEGNNHEMYFDYDFTEMFKTVCDRFQRSFERYHDDHDDDDDTGYLKNRLEKISVDVRNDQGVLDSSTRPTPNSEQSALSDVILAKDREIQSLLEKVELLTSKEAQISDMEEELRTLSTYYYALQAELQEEKEKNLAWQGSLPHSSNDSENPTVDHDQQMGISPEMEQLRARCYELEDENTQLRHEIQLLNMNYDTIQNEKEALSQALEKMDAIESANDDIMPLKKQLEELQISLESEMRERFSVEKDHQDLLVVLGEQLERMRVLEDKLASLGYDVTSEEEDEERKGREKEFDTNPFSEKNNTIHRSYQPQHLSTPPKQKRHSAVLPEFDSSIYPF